jgi:acyl dehydratase
MGVTLASHDMGRGMSPGGPTVSSWISPKARKGDPSGIAGRGLFAVEPLVAGEVVAVKGGHIVDTAALHTLPEHLQNSEIQIAEGLHLVALGDDEYEPVMLFINHSCEPNVGFAGNTVLAAMRDVASGEELTTDYALFDASATTPMACSCGTPSCRGTIRGDDWRHPALRARHAGWFSRYLADRHARLRSYEVEAFNTATASSNRIHDDDVARRFGFSGGLVPGVDVYAYLCHLPAEAWGERWLAGGTMTARFRSPVYDGDRVLVTGLPEGTGDGETLDLEVRDSSGAVCAIARAAVTAPAADGTDGAVDVDADVDPDDWPAGPPPDPDDRPPATAEVLRSAELGAVAATFRADHAADYLDDVREELPQFRATDGAVAHPGWLLRFANSILVANVALGPWIHTESTVGFLGLVGDGDRVETRARVAGVRERGGHQYVDLDVVQHVAGRPIARIAHTAIFRLRDDDPADPDDR